ncbi:MAG: hypothetical protein KDC81_14795 [Flavobacteriaceae bacterium]|nr:hypothetical protein [Flavobacteriaceae bacterium]
MRITEKALANLEQIKNEIPIWIRDAILENRGQIVNLVKFEQLSKGLNSDGQPLSWSGGTGFYAQATQSFAYRDNVRIPKVEGWAYNFSWSGQTLDNMYIDSVDVSKSTYEIETVKSKENLLEGIYGEIFKLTDEHNKYVNENIIQPYISKKIMENILKF